jgi:superoxide dismutase, Cu-Zn family
MKADWMIKAAFLTLVGSSPAYAANGVAQIKGTTPDSRVNGTVSFVDTKQGLRVSATIKGAPPGKHGFHIHEFGSCEDVGNAAGSHYNPASTPHGLVSNDPKRAHKGDMGNIEIGADGNGRLEITLPNVALEDNKYTVGGRAVIIHDKHDDMSQPTGNAGGRIGCGVILITGK